MASSVVATPAPSWEDEPDVLLLLLPLLILFCAVALVAVTPLLFCVLLRCRGGIALRDTDGPVNIAYEEHRESRGALQATQQRWLEQADDATRLGYERAAQWCVQHPPSSPRDTDITMPQFLGIQEKGVSAWSFDPVYEANVGAIVSARTEIQFFADSPGMAASEGGACAMQTNLPLPKMNDVYYWEAKMFAKPATTSVAVGLATKPYPPFRFPGLCRHSVGYFSEDGFKCYNHPFNAQSYGPAYVHGDVVGVGYRPRTGTVFFTRNGRRLEEAYIGLHGHNVFPTVAANGDAEVHVNFGQAGFVLIEANVKRWGLAPMVGTLAPPPAYGQDKDSILIETGYEPRAEASGAPGSSRAVPDAPDALPRVPSYAASVSATSSRSNSAHSGAHGIRLDTLGRPPESPPPYVSEPAPMSPPTPAPAAPPSPARHQPPTRPVRSAWSAARAWLAQWSAGRDAPRDGPSPTELVGVTIE
ncbi:Protein ssh4 [Malassezia obtusa]|uniref:Protein ssh4 n=1 Tax=Malassezia obtusa TaxID=76774 RepID=A0AAF0DWP8_9BASI|nr:Protein ssh4 [Malassezia obtusa]